MGLAPAVKKGGVPFAVLTVTTLIVTISTGYGLGLDYGLGLGFG